MPVKKKKPTQELVGHLATPHAKDQTNSLPNPAEHSAKKSLSAKRASVDRALLTALKENNKCLAAALDESRREFRKLQTEYVNLQQERHQLLEKIAELKTKESHQNLETLCAQVQPTYDLLEQAMKDISCAEIHLRRVFQSQAKDPYIGPDNSGTIPTSISPISVQSNRNQAVIPSVCFEANTGLSDSTEGDVRVYPRTPCPSHTEKCHPITYSTPVCDDANPSSTCRSSATEFEDFPPENSHHNDHAGSLGDKCPKQHEKKLMRRQQVQRPQRKCATINISYQEPDLKRKLCQGDHSSGQLNFSAHSKQRLVLHDITNQK